MKKAAQVGRSKRKEAVPKTFAAYLATVPRPARKTLQRMRRVIQSAVPRRATETISYRIPAFRDETGVLLWFADQDRAGGGADHCARSKPARSGCHAGQTASLRMNPKNSVEAAIIKIVAAQPKSACRRAGFTPSVSPGQTNLRPVNVICDATSDSADYPR